MLLQTENTVFANCSPAASKRFRHKRCKKCGPNFIWNALPLSLKKGGGVGALPHLHDKSVQKPVHTGIVTDTWHAMFSDCDTNKDAGTSLRWLLGDWVCKCRFCNFSRREKCNECGVKKQINCRLVRKTFKFITCISFFQFNYQL